MGCVARKVAKSEQNAAALVIQHDFAFICLTNT